MAQQESLFIGGGGEGNGAAQALLLRFANRHGLIAGATGTGKTITMQIMAEGFSRAGVPVFLTDIKGDVGGMATPGTPRDAFARRAETIGLADIGYGAMPVTFWDLFGAHGHPVRATIAEMGSPGARRGMMKMMDAANQMVRKKTPRRRSMYALEIFAIKVNLI